MKDTTEHIPGLRLIRPTEQDTLSLLFRIGAAERQLENLDVPAEVLDRIANDISDGAAKDEPPRMPKEGAGSCAD